jgi:Zn-dependent protease with chaperone function
MLTGGYLGRVSEQIEAAWKLEGISSRAYQHPADRAALAGLAKVPYLDEVVRRLVALGYERALRAASLGSAVRLGERQLPRIWSLHRQVFNTLDTDPVPDLYLTQFPLANAYAIGTDKPIVLLNSELVRILDDDGRRVVLAHEAAHVHSDHVLYQTALLILMRLGSSIRIPILAGLPLLAIQLALLEWWRAAELSCDRAAALVTRDPQAVCKSLMAIAAGEEVASLNLDAFIAQGMDYSEGGTGLERMTKLLQDLRVTHPMPVRRVKFLLDWVHGGEYDRMVRGDYMRRGEEPTPREEADAAGVFYTERISGAFAQAGSSIADVGQQLGEWLKRTRERGDGGGDDAGGGGPGGGAEE